MRTTTRTLAASILVALMMAACGEPPAPAKPAPTKAAAPVTAPAVAPPAEPRGRVFMIASEAGLAPVACHLAHVPKFSQGDECLALLKTGSNARLESGQVSRITGVGKADCGEGQTALVEAPPEPPTPITAEQLETLVKAGLAAFETESFRSLLRHDPRPATPARRSPGCRASPRSTRPASA